MKETCKGTEGQTKTKESTITKFRKFLISTRRFDILYLLITTCPLQGHHVNFSAKTFAVGF